MANRMPRYWKIGLQSKKFGEASIAMVVVGNKLGIDMDNHLKLTECGLVSGVKLT